MRKLIVGTGVLVALALVGWRIQQRIVAVRASAPPEDERIPVATIRVPLATVVDALRLTGTVAPQSQVTVYSNVYGRVLSVRKREGQAVRQGELLASIKCTQPQLMVSQLQAAEVAARSGLVTLESTYERSKALKSRQAISDAQWEATQAQVEAGRAQLQQVQAQLDLALSQRDDCSLVAPIAGVISEVFLEPGDVIAASQMGKSSPMATIVAVNQVKVVAAVDERDLGSLRLDQEAEVAVDAFPDLTFDGRVVAVAPVLDPRSRTAEVEVLIDNPSGRLMPGMFARVRLIRARRDRVPVIPADALLLTTGKPIAFVDQDGLARRRVVTTGVRDGQRIEVLDGVEAGENLVVLGHQRLRDGVQIREGLLPEAARRAMGLDFFEASGEPLAEIPAQGTGVVR